jgi:sensor histidine kinase YesM
MHAPERLPVASNAVPRLHWAERLRGRFQGHERERISAYDFIRWHLPFSFTVVTLIPIILTTIFQEWYHLGLALTYSYCIGLCVFALLMFLRVFVLQRIVLPVPIVFVAHVVIVPVAFLVGCVPAYWLTGQPVGNLTNAALFTFIGASFSMLQMVSVDRQRRADRAERTAAAARLQVLQAQIEPHFLFNTLAGLNELIATDASRAQEMLGHLDHYLRASLAHARSDASSTLATEFELLRAYLSIMQMRLPLRLKTEITCEEECARLPFPPMLVQPLVENAVTHGIEPLREGGSVRIDARRIDGNLIVTVEDSGAGPTTSARHGAGIGLRTIRDRLDALFGRGASLELEGLSPRGTRARITIPLKLLRSSTP